MMRRSQSKCNEMRRSKSAKLLGRQVRCVQPGLGFLSLKYAHSKRDRDDGPRRGVYVVKWLPRTQEVALLSLSAESELEDDAMSREDNERKVDLKEAERAGVVSKPFRTISPRTLIERVANQDAVSGAENSIREANAVASEMQKPALSKSGGLQKCFTKRLTG